ncbi:hypothetical protein SESBI_04591 [Sesbania bispinosa]|nr:hypothetical protein SESBI_04591 [Sesbania bispinosa]
MLLAIFEALKVMILAWVVKHKSHVYTMLEVGSDMKSRVQACPNNHADLMNENHEDVFHGSDENKGSDNLEEESDKCSYEENSSEGRLDYSEEEESRDSEDDRYNDVEYGDSDEGSARNDGSDEEESEDDEHEINNEDVTNEIATDGDVDMGNVDFKNLTANGALMYHFPNVELDFTFYSWYAREKKGRDAEG